MAAVRESGLWRVRGGRETSKRCWCPGAGGRVEVVRRSEWKWQ